MKGCNTSAGMSGVKARKWVLRSYFSGMPKREDLEIVEEELPAIKDGGQVTCGLGRSQTQTAAWIASSAVSRTRKEGLVTLYYAFFLCALSHVARLCESLEREDLV